MKLFEIINEAKKVKTDTQTDTDSVQDMFNRRDDATFNDQDSKQISKPSKQRTASPSVQNKRRTKLQTQQAMGNADIGDEGRAHLANMQDMEFSDDEYATDDAAFDGAHAIDYDGVEPRVTTPDTLPAVMNKALAQTGEGMELEWNQVNNLPGYMQQGIRMLGRQIFATQTNTPIEDIQVLANLNDQGPNSKKEILAFGGWLKHNAIKDNQFDMDFEAIMPGYKAEVAVYSSNNATFMLVQDAMGQYVYAWPGGRNINIGHDSNPRITQDNDQLDWLS